MQPSPCPSYRYRPLAHFFDQLHRVRGKKCGHLHHRTPMVEPQPEKSRMRLSVIFNCGKSGLRAASFAARAETELPPRHKARKPQRKKRRQQMHCGHHRPRSDDTCQTLRQWPRHLRYAPRALCGQRYKPAPPRRAEPNRPKILRIMIINMYMS